MNKRLLNALPDITLLGAMAGAWLLDRFIPVAELIQPPVSYAGWLLVVIGAVLAAKTIAELRKRASSDVVRAPDVLITYGVFALSRNPLYMSELLIVVGLAVALGSLAAFAAPIVYVGVVGGVVIPFEESQLRKKFGAKYQAYASSVRRWL